MSNTRTHDTVLCTLTIAGRIMQEIAVGGFNAEPMSDKIVSQTGIRGDTIVSTIHDPRRNLTINLLHGADSAFLQVIAEERRCVKISMSRQDGEDKLDVPYAWIKSVPGIGDDQELEIKRFVIETHQTGEKHGEQTVARASA